MAIWWKFIYITNVDTKLHFPHFAQLVKISHNYVKGERVCYFWVTFKDLSQKEDHLVSVKIKILNLRNALWWTSKKFWCNNLFATVTTTFNMFPNIFLVVHGYYDQEWSQGLSTIFCIFQFWFDSYFNEWKWFLQLFDKIMNRPAVFVNACILGIFGKNVETPTWHHIPRANWFLSRTLTRVWHNTRRDDRAGKMKRHK